jgi:dolichyl-phosphate beta-glucosyltransferase
MSVEVVVVNDGSTDMTASLLETWKGKFSCYEVVSLPTNRGKGAAIREGLRTARGGAIIFTDADLPYGVNIFGELYTKCINQPGISYLYGSRTNRDSVSEHGYGFLRQFGSSFFSTVVRWLVIADVRDTQCGIKLLSRSFADLVLACSTVDRFAFDIELFVIALENKMSIQDFPVVLNHRKESSVRIITDTILMLIDIVKIRLKIWQGVYVRH